MTATAFTFRRVCTLWLLTALSACPELPDQVESENNDSGDVAASESSVESASAAAAPAADSPPRTPSEPRGSRSEPAVEPQADAGADALPDLRLEAPERGSVNFRQARFVDESCEVLDGCATETGSRSLMGLEFALRNDGAVPIELGSPSEADIFQRSRCDKASIPGLFAAELRDERGRVVSRGSLATKCIASDGGDYSCTSQGLGADESSEQPQGACDFLDITDVEPGEYTISVTVNPERQIEEADYDNNTIEWTIPITRAETESCAHITCGDSCCPVGASCDDGACALPDLRVNYEAAADRTKLQVVERSFGLDSCELEEACVGGAGRRRLLLFEGRLENWGPGDLDLGPQEGNPLFTYSACHDHYHTENFAEYLLRNPDGTLAASGHKVGYCVADTAPIEDPSAPMTERPAPGRSTPCNKLTAGYADVYDIQTPCQWIDVTDVPPGDYLLEVTINPDGHVAEVDTKNNTIEVPLTLTERGLR
jgi:hypothetical protein